MNVFILRFFIIKPLFGAFHYLLHRDIVAAKMLAKFAWWHLWQP